MDYMPGPTTAPNIWTVSTPKRTKSPSGKPWRVRWSVRRADGRSARRERKFDTAVEADQFVSMVVAERQKTQDWSLETGLPVSLRVSGRTVVDAALEYFQENSNRWEQHTIINKAKQLGAVLCAIGFDKSEAPSTERVAELRAFLLGGPEVDQSNALPVEMLTRKLVRDRMPNMVANIRYNVAGHSTENARRRIAGAFFAWLVDNDAIEENPLPRKAAATKKEVAEKLTKADIPSAEKVRSWLNEADDDLRLFFEVMYATGCRTGEARALKKNDLLGGSMLRIDESMARETGSETTRVKTGRSRTVSIDSKLHTRLVEASFDYDDEDSLFGEFFTANKIAKAFKKTTGERPYILRHTHASLLLLAGVPPVDVAKRLGHSVQTLLSTYAGVIEGVDHSDLIAAALG